MEKHRFNLHLPGLLKVLAEHLYSTKKVGDRELIQNAHDSCVRRKIEEGRGDYQPRIDLAIDSGVEKGTGIITGRAWIRPRLHAPRKDPRPLFFRQIASASQPLDCLPPQRNHEPDSPRDGRHGKMK